MKKNAKKTVKATKEFLSDDKKNTINKAGKTFKVYGGNPCASFISHACTFVSVDLNLFEQLTVSMPLTTA